MRGTLLNTATVTVGSLIGLAIGKFIPADAQGIALNGLGLVVVGIGVKMFLGSKNTLIVAGSIALGGILGYLLHIQTGLDQLAIWVKTSVGGGGRFSEGLVAAVVLFCVGPMTILGCLQDGLEGKSELLALKSTMDGVAALFFTVAYGVGVLFSAAFVLIIQGALTLAAKPLSFLREDSELLAEFEGTGGPIMIAIALSLLDVKRLPTANYLPALLLAPLTVLAVRRLSSRRAGAESMKSEA
ncbi:MAG: DUF554 family protein [Armatimonadetes bacterium]|nr:DUF554 family protein [Armatimonadota bacterium]